VGDIIQSGQIFNAGTGRPGNTVQRIAAFNGVDEPESDELEHPAITRLLTNIIMIKSVFSSGVLHSAQLSSRHNGQLSYQPADRSPIDTLALSDSCSPSAAPEACFGNAFQRLSATLVPSV
jgi:hypothetical protein